MRALHEHGIPVVNLSHYRGGTSVERARFVQTFGEGLREFGFVTVQDHGIDDGLIRRSYEDVKRFFALPESSKQRYFIPGGAGQRGYTGFGKEHAKNRTVGDMKEFWHVGRELPPGHPRRASYGGNVWPSEVPTFKANTWALFQALDEAAALMLEAIADYFGIWRSTFSEMARDGNSILRLIHYPPLRERFIPGGVRAAEHEDINLITLLCEGTSSGLELLTRDGKWLPIDTLRGQIVVDSGDMLSRVTGELIPSTTHRVVNPRTAEEDVERYSMPFFCHPFPECRLEQIPGAEKGKVYPTVTADQFLTQRLKEIGLVK